MSARPPNVRRRNFTLLAAAIWLGILSWQGWQAGQLEAQLADAWEHEVFLKQRHALENVQMDPKAMGHRLTHAEIMAKLKAILPYAVSEMYRYSAEWQEFVAALTPGDIAFALQYMDGTPEMHLSLSEFGYNPRLDMHRLLLQQWMKSEPTAALDYTAAIPEQGVRRDLLHILLYDWGKTNPNEAAAWAEHQPAGVLRDEEIGDFIEHLPPEIGWDLLQNTSITSPRLRTWFYVRTLEGLAEDHPAEAAQATATALPSGEGREVAVSTIASKWAAQDPTAALGWAGALPAGTIRDRAMDAAVGTWVKNDPRAAAQYAVSLPDDQARDRILDTVVEGWANVDSAATGQWMQAMPAGRLRDEAMDAFVDAVVGKNPDRAAGWAAAIGDPATRIDAISTVATAWLKTDRTAATTWLAQSGLSQARLQKLLAAPSEEK